MQRPGDVLVLPADYWRASCNLARYTVGFGGKGPVEGLVPWEATMARETSAAGEAQTENVTLRWASPFADRGRCTSCNGAGGEAAAVSPAEPMQNSTVGTSSSRRVVRRSSVRRTAVPHALQRAKPPTLVEPSNHSCSAGGGGSA